MRSGTVFLGHLLNSRANEWNVKAKEEMLTVYQQAVEGCAAGHFLYLQPLLSLCQAFIFNLASLERQSFLVCDGIQTLALVMRWSFSVLLSLRRAPSYLFS